MSRDEILYNDETKLKDLTVGELKDIILEVLSRTLYTTEKHIYHYAPGYCVRPDIETYPNPYIPQGPTCEQTSEITGRPEIC